MIEFLIKIMATVGINSHQDKVLHVIAGLIIGAGGIMVGAEDWSIAMVLTSAIGKEMYDVIYKGIKIDELPFKVALQERFDYYDALATIGGGWVGMALAGWAL